MQQKLNVLILDDDMDFTEELSEVFIRWGFTAFKAHTGKEGMAILNREEIDLLILDVRLPGISGLDILREAKITWPKLEVIVVSAHGDMDTVIKAMRVGAIDYLRKPFRQIDIQIAIERTEKFLHLQRRLSQAEEKNSLISRSLEERIERHMIGISQQMKEVTGLAMTAATFSGTNVLITGESGTGKENIARIIHYAGDRKDHILYSVNSGSIAETLYESEFFGHKKGSFTGAESDKKGFLEICNKGTLFLDEIADMPLGLQAKLLRAMEEKKFSRVGDPTLISSDFRIISATNHNLETLVGEKKFRLDLMHRLNTFTIHLTPLRERPEDIEPLLLYFTGLIARNINKPVPRVDKELIRALVKYEFPGNVRELKNMTERAVILSKGNSLGISDFPIHQTRSSPSRKQPVITTLKDTEITLIRQALEQAGFNQKAAADLLGISRDALIRKLKKYKLTIRRNLEP